MEKREYIISEMEKAGAEVYESDNPNIIRVCVNKGKQPNEIHLRSGKVMNWMGQADPSPNPQSAPDFYHQFDINISSDLDKIQQKLHEQGLVGIRLVSDPEAVEIQWKPRVNKHAKTDPLAQDGFQRRGRKTGQVEERV